MSKYKKPVPEDRTIVDGIWSDILDDWSSTFDTNESGETYQKIIDKDAQKLQEMLSESNAAIFVLGVKILNQLKLLNARIEEAFDTKIKDHDI